MKLSQSFSGALRQFSYWIANGTVGYPLLEGIILFQMVDVPETRKKDSGGIHNLRISAGCAVGGEIQLD